MDEPKGDRVRWTACSSGWIAWRQSRAHANSRLGRKNSPAPDGRSQQVYDRRWRRQNHGLRRAVGSRAGDTFEYNAKPTPRRGHTGDVIVHRIPLSAVRAQEILISLLGKDPDAIVVSFASGDPELSERMFAEIQRLEPDRRHFLITPPSSARQSTLQIYLHALRNFSGVSDRPGAVVIGSRPALPCAASRSCFC